MSKEWEEVILVEKEGRHELVLSGETIAKKISQSGLDENIFNLTTLNFLEISRAGVSSLPTTIVNLQHLLNLVLHSNNLTLIPKEIGKLSKLKFLDLSKNKLSSLPSELGDLKDLQSLNVSCNELTTFFDVAGLASLHILEISHNKLEELPMGIDSTQLSLLQTIMAYDNKLNRLPADLNNLLALKTLDISNNCLDRLLPSLSICPKLKELKYSGNKLADKRLAKMAEQCSTKSVLDYLFNQMEKEGKLKNGGKDGGGTKGAPKSTKKTAKKIAIAHATDEVVVEEEKDTIEIQHYDATPGVVVVSTNDVESVRPFIVCCIVHNINLNKSQNLYKRFINLQNKLHDEICGKRVIATVATHDLDKISKPVLTYDAKEPESIMIQPLMKLKAVTATVLMSKLHHEAEELRREKKRNTVSGIHKYLELLDGQTLYPCLMDSANIVISFPPITNSNATRISKTTRHILIEITSSQSRDVCKKIMDQFLADILEMNLGETEDEAKQRTDVEVKESLLAAPNIQDPLHPETIKDDVTTEANDLHLDPENNDLDPDNRRVDDNNLGEEAGGEGRRKKYLLVQQVKIVDHLGALKVVYPSKIDLKSGQKFDVVRNF